MAVLPSEPLREVRLRTDDRDITVKLSQEAEALLKFDADGELLPLVSLDVRGRGVAVIADRGVLNRIRAVTYRLAGSMLRRG